MIISTPGKPRIGDQVDLKAFFAANKRGEALHPPVSANVTFMGKSGQKVPDDNTIMFAIDTVAAFDVIGEGGVSGQIFERRVMEFVGRNAGPGIFVCGTIPEAVTGFP